MKYPVVIEKDGDSSYTVSFPDIPEAISCGDTYDDALSEAADALITAFEFYFEDARQIPEPSEITGDYVPVPTSVWAKVLVLNTMVSQEIKQTEVAKLAGITKQEMQRITDLGHNTKIDKLAAVLEAMGKQLTLTVA
jgi:antitoxin HicB